MCRLENSSVKGVRMFEWVFPIVNNLVCDYFYYVKEENLFFSILLGFHNEGLQIKLTKGRLAREKTNFFIKNLREYTEKYKLRRQLEFGTYITSG